MLLGSNLIRGLFAITLVISTARAAAVDVFIDTAVYNPFEPEGLDNDDTMLLAREQLRSDLVAGLYDALDINMSASTSTVDFEVTGASFVAADSSVQNQILDNLMEYFTEAFVTNYKATVNPATNRLSEVAFFRRLGIPITSLPARTPAESLLSSYARQWAYQTSLRNGPNCWHTAVASTNKGWSRHRYMNYSEFNCQLRNGYELLDTTRNRLQFGDVISLVDGNNTPVHGFVYLGPDAANTSKHIVFTKNGYARGGFYFQDYNTVVNYIYPGNRILYYRAISDLADPSAISGTPCDREYASDFEDFLEERGMLVDEGKPDPIIVAGMKKVDPRLLPALELE